LSPILLAVIAAATPAAANTCSSFGSYSCSRPTPNLVRFEGTGKTGQSVGILLGAKTFDITFNGNRSLTGDDLIILAASPNALTGKVNGVGFISLSTFPEVQAIHAIEDTWSGMGILFNSPSFGYANVGTIGSGNVSITVNGVLAGTIFYAVVINPQSGKILYVTPNSEAGVFRGSSTATPEPGSLVLLGTGLTALAGFVRRKSGQS
jgi:hypothetical protein